MIVTVTLNPAIDKTAELDDLSPGELNRLRSVVTDVGGKGVNVSKTVAALGETSVAIGFAGGAPGDEIVRFLERGGIKADFVKVEGTTRTNLKVLDRGTRLTELNEPGVTVTPRELSALVEKFSVYAGPSAVFVLSGSLPGGVDAEFYARAIRTVHSAGALAFLDADGEAFKAAVEEAPDLIKPNRHELAEYFNKFGKLGKNENLGLRELEELCLKMRAKGVKKIALSMGADGAMFVNGKNEKNENSLYAPSVPVEVRSSVGAGDSMMAALAFAAERRMSWEDAAALSVAVSAGAVTTVGTKPPERKLVDELLKQVQLKPIPTSN
jgi:1-phosphofructokinase